MRERRGVSQVRRGPGRITPAYAGKTSDTMTAEENIKDHPRVCGKDGLAHF